jgi:glycosyltransferase involved in cell wall biosynthesis
VLEFCELAIRNVEQNEGVGKPLFPLLSASPTALGKTRRMTRAILINASYPDSIINFRTPLIKALIELDFEVHISAPNLTAIVVEKVAALGAHAHDVPLGRTGQNLIEDISYFLALRKLMLQIKPGYVLGYTIKPNIWGSLAARSCGISSSSLVTGLGYAFIRRPGLKRKIVQKIARLLYRIATWCNETVIFQNGDDARDFLTGGALGDSSKIRLVNGSGVDLKHYQPGPLPEAPIFLLIARLLRSKGLEEFANAAKLVMPELPDARFQIAGFIDEGPDAIDPQMLDEWVALGIEYLGPLEDVRPAITAASIYVLPSWREGTPRTVLEAMAMGRPVITTDAPGCRQTVEDEVSGLLVPVNNAAALAAAMKKIGSDRQLRESMGSAGLERAKSRYEAHAVALATIDAMRLRRAKA